VCEICCLVRASSIKEAQERTINSLQERGVHGSLSSAALKKINSLPSNLSSPKLGLAVDEYDRIKSLITDLVHCAWSVNFRLQLSSFEKDCISGTCALINLCLEAQQPLPATFNFCSSASTVSKTEGDNIPESLPAKLSYAQDMGYAQSKLVMENLCMRASEQTSIKARVLRIGQIIGDTQHGIWNATEGISLILQSAQTIGALPRLDESPRWLPVDVVADSVIESSLSNAPSGVMNIVNQYVFHWTREFLPQLHKAGLEFEELDQRAWIQRLRNANPDPVANPPIKLVEFFASKYDNDKVRKDMQWHTSNAIYWSPSLEHARVPDQELVDKIIAHFKRICW
jgi:thioester reductase-like protein